MASVDLPELEAPFRKMIRPGPRSGGRGSMLITIAGPDSSREPGIQAAHCHAAVRAVLPKSECRPGSQREASVQAGATWGRQLVISREVHGWSLLAAGGSPARR